ncbi:ATP-binding protein [Deinococcus sp. Marseille-Q6407]|uniref:ATP-binding protein n=1 Tax=Deinococcus sp. Marseille-Q6407 TaxID=2969223 RepID=UPI0021C146C8|nr:ATP-binding protein [Deinococcus sp. Marseille-Q6407]
MIEAMRALGYSLQAAIADIVDNSISANARRIEIRLDWREHQATVTVLDDGIGMNRETLINAMRPGSRNPLEKRAAGDLGRFGMGLKTASFSQCRCLTVATRVAGGPIEVRRWDLDHVAATEEWQLLHGFRPGSEWQADRLTGIEHGTLVLWECLDRLTGTVGADPASQQRARAQFLAQARKVEQHLAMTFHQFLTGQGKVELLLNGKPIKPWDPLLASREYIEQQPEEWLWLDGQAIRVQGTVLPHHSRLAGPDLLEAEGPRGWNSQQGFHVYRDGRLLVAGGWLGLGLERDDRFRLARIRIDLPSSLDAQWGVDIRKARVTVPPSLRERLRSIARLTRDRALRVYRHRARLLSPRRPDEPVSLWTVRTTTQGGYQHEIDRLHPLIQALQQVPGAQPGLNALLKMIEATLPVERIWLTETTRDQSAPESPDELDALRKTLTDVVTMLVSNGYNEEEALLLARGMEPFCNHPGITPLPLPPESAT